MSIKDLRILYVHHGIRKTMDVLHDLEKENIIETFNDIELPKKNKNKSNADGLAEITSRIREINPNILIWHHVGKFETKLDIIDEIKKINPSLLFIYQEMDAYGGIFKPMPPTMRTLVSNADVVLSCCGSPMTSMLRKIMKPNADILWFGHKAIPDMWPDREEVFSAQKLPKKYDVVMLGSNLRSRAPLVRNFSLTQFPGSYMRWNTTRAVTKAFPGKTAIYGAGWSGFKEHAGIVPLAEQIASQWNARVSAMWNHYDKSGFYTSDRPIIAMLSGIPHVTNYQPGHELLFGENGKHLFWAKDQKEYVDIIRYLLSMSPENRNNIGMRAYDYARKHFSVKTEWISMLRCISDRLTIK